MCFHYEPEHEIRFWFQGRSRLPYLQCGPVSDGISVFDKLRISWTVSDSYWA